MARKIEPRKISSCSTLCLLVVFTQQLEIIVTSLHKHQGIRLFFNGTTHVEHALPTITLFLCFWHTLFKDQDSAILNPV